jgi:hypothetical protein
MVGVAGAATLLGGNGQAEASDGSPAEILITASKWADGSDGWLRIGDSKHWVSGDCRSQLVDKGAKLTQVKWSVIRDLPNASRQKCGTLLIPTNGSRILITADKWNKGSDGWLRIGNSKHWVSSDCRNYLVGLGAKLTQVEWPVIRDLPDAPRQDCSTLLVPKTGPQVLITLDKWGDGSDGWLRIGDSKHWVGSDCRNYLVAKGAQLTQVVWPVIRDLPDAPRQDCDALLDSEPTTVVSVVPDPSTTEPSTTEPETTEPKTTEPETTEPETTEPKTTEPKTTEPESTEPKSTDVSTTGVSTTTPTVPAPPAPTTPSSVTTTSVADTPTSMSMPHELDAAENLALILGNNTRNRQYDDNEFRGVPADQIEVSDLTVNRDIYNEGLLDTTNSGYFRVKCEVSHFAYDDPIVFPNQPGRAHLHMFFGNTEANAYSTYDSLLNSGTGTCNGEDLNRTSYWVPALLDAQGNALLPEQIMVYYKNDNFRLNGANELVDPFPENLRMIAGNGGATSPQTTPTGGVGSQPVISFSCGPMYRSNDRRQALIPDCSGAGNSLEMQISFPQCFDEDSGTYLSDQSHMSYSEGGYYGARCPDSHSTDISSIMYRIFFRPGDYGGSFTDLHLSSDVKHDRILPGGTTAHADWFGAWHPGAMDLWIGNCNNTRADCETGLLDRDPALSLVLRKRGFFPRGYVAPAEELIKLCPGKQFDPNDPLRSVANCHH